MRPRTFCSCGVAIPALTVLGLISRAAAGPIVDGANAPAKPPSVPADARSDGTLWRSTLPSPAAGGGAPTGRGTNPGRRLADVAVQDPIATVPQYDSPSFPPRPGTGVGSTGGMAGNPGGASLPAISSVGGASGSIGGSAPAGVQGSGAGQPVPLTDPTPSSSSIASGAPSGGLATGSQGAGSGLRASPAAQELSPVGGPTGNSGAGPAQAAGAIGSGRSAPAPGVMAAGPPAAIPGNGPGNAGTQAPPTNLPSNPGNLPGAAGSAPQPGGPGNAASVPPSGPMAGAPGNGGPITTPTFGAAAGVGLAPATGAQTLNGGETGPNSNPLASIYNAAMLSQILGNSSRSSGGGTASKDNNAATTNNSSTTTSTTSDHAATTTGGTSGVSLPSVQNRILDATTGFPSSLTRANVSPPPLDIQGTSTGLPPVQAGDPVRLDASTGIPGSAPVGPLVNLDIPEPSPLFLLVFASGAYLGRNALRRRRRQAPRTAASSGRASRRVPCRAPETRDDQG